MGFYAKCIYASAAATANSGSICLRDESVSRIDIHAEYGDITGTWKVEVSSDPRARAGHPDYTSSVWDDKTTEFALTDPAGSAADFAEEFDNANYGFIRITYTHSAGTGLLYLWVECK